MPSVVLKLDLSCTDVKIQDASICRRQGNHISHPLDVPKAWKPEHDLGEIDFRVDLEQEKWSRALQKIKSEHKSVANVSDLADDEAAALLQSLRANAHHDLPSSTSAAPNRGKDVVEPQLMHDIIGDLQKHNNKLRLELKNAVTGMECY